MTGRSEVFRLKQRLDATFARARQLGDDLEVKSDFAKYLCILVSGYLEKAIAELVLELSRHNAAPSVQRFVEYHTRHLTNVNATRLIQLLGTFDPDWGKNLDQYIADERKAALDSVVGLRNQIAHGESVGVTFARVKSYYERIQAVIDRVADLCAPIGK